MQLKPVSEDDAEFLNKDFINNQIENDTFKKYLLDNVNYAIKTWDNKYSKDKFDLAASFQKTIEEILHEKTKRAFEIYLNENASLKKTFVVAGGVAANQGIKNILENLSKENKFECLFPDINLCSDNAAMIALVGLEKFKKKLFNELDFKVNPRWQLDEKAQFLKGAGVKI